MSFAIFMLTFNLLGVRAEEIEVSAKSAILMCADSGSVVFRKNENEKLSMASTTKIMTSLLTLEAAEIENKEVKITQEMVAVEGSSMGLRVGNVVTLDTLVKGMLMCSGNDAANSAAIAVGGTVEKFAVLMNERAKQIGMKNTNFVTPSGLDDDNHYSTAYDMALLGAYAMENDKFKEIASQKSATVDFIEPCERHSYANHNKLITKYKGCIGVKTGFTKKSGRCLVSCAERDGVRLIAVTLNAPDDWNDHIKMFDYGFSKVKSVKCDDTNMNYSHPIVGASENEILLNAAFPVEFTVNSDDEDKITKRLDLPDFFYAPVEKGQIMGTIYYEVNGVVAGSTNIISACDVEENSKLSFWDRFINFFRINK